MSEAITDLLLLGAGHAHLNVLRQFALRPVSGVRVTLVAREALALHAPMLPDLLYGSCDFDSAHTDLVPLAASAGARLILAEARGIDLAARLLQVKDRPDIGFDILSIDIGGVSRPSGKNQKQAAEAGIPLQPVGQFLTSFGELEQKLPQGAHIAVVGNTPASVELTLALAHRFAGRFAFTLVSQDPEPLFNLPPRARRLARAALVHAGVGIVNGVTVSRHDRNHLYLSDGTALDVSEALWTTNAQAPAWLAQTTGLAVTEAGAVCVDATLRSISHDFVFATGNSATMVGIPPGQDDTLAANTGTHLAENLRRTLSGQALRPQTKPARLTQLLALPTIIRISGVDAVAWRNNLSFAGGWLLRWRNKTEQVRLQQYASLRPTASPTLALPRTLRASPGIMQRAIADLPTPQSSDIVLGLDVQDNATLVMPPLGSATVQSVSLLRTAVQDPFIAGEIAAAHAMGPIFAMGAHPWTALALAQLPALSAESLENDLKLMLHGAARCLSGVHCMLIGGDDVQNPQQNQTEALFGFSITGLVRPEQAWSMHTLRSGDALVITKPIGSGAIVAGNARGLVPARRLLTAIASMRRADAAAMDILRAHDVHACTNLAEAGLAGTVLNMLRASGLAAVLEQAGIPALPGASDLCDTQTPIQDERIDGPVHPLLFAPLISGGLLAGVPRNRVASCVQALREAGMTAAVIGNVEAYSGTGAQLRVSGTLPA